MEDWLARICEIVDKYRPKIVFFDWWIQVECLKQYLRKFAAYYYNRADEWGEEVTLCYKYDSFMYGTAVNDIERGQLSEISPVVWQSDTSVAKNSWSYTEGNDYKDPADIVCDLIDVVSKNGVLMLNIGPKADGTIPDTDRHILLEVGGWLAANGEGIYGASHWKRFGEGPTRAPEGHFTDTMRAGYTSEDFRFTFKDGCLYVFALSWPEDGMIRIKALGKDAGKCAFHGLIGNVSILGFGGEVKAMRVREHLAVYAPGVRALARGYPVCVKVELG
jgi:alpha-L-fucosidase